MPATERYFSPERGRLRNVGCLGSLVCGGLGLAVLSGVDVGWLPRRCPISGIPMGEDLLLVAGGLLALALFWPGAFRPIYVMAALAAWPIHRLSRGRTPVDRGREDSAQHNGPP